jgi:hypothetical protein
VGVTVSLSSKSTRYVRGPESNRNEWNELGPDHLILRQVNMVAGAYIRAADWDEQLAARAAGREEEYIHRFGGVGDQPIDEESEAYHHLVRIDREEFESIWKEARRALGAE